MLDPFLLWLELTPFSVWIRESESLLAFPGILTVHTIGLALLAGLNAALDFRLLGWVEQIPPRTFERFLPLMWLGLWLNVASGIALFIAYPTKAVTNPVFYLKLSLIAAALVILKRVRRRLGAGDESSRRLKQLALASLVCWAAAITAGRLLAYTFVRLMASDATY